MSAEQEVRQVHEERIAAFVAGDVGKLDKIMAANVVFVSPLGQVQRKDSLIADLASGNLRVERFETNDLNISVSGQTAVATYRVSTRASYKGQPRNGQYMMMSVYGNEGGRWILVGQQSTQLAPSPQTQPSPAR